MATAVALARRLVGAHAALLRGVGSGAGAARAARLPLALPRSRPATSPLSTSAAPPPAAADAAALIAEPAVAARAPRREERVFEFRSVPHSIKKMIRVTRLVNVVGLPVWRASELVRWLPQKGALYIRSIFDMALRRSVREDGMEARRVVLGAARRGAPRRCCAHRDQTPRAAGRRLDPRARSLGAPHRPTTRARPLAPRPRAADRLWLGRGTYLKRPDYKAKGRMGMIHKPRTHIFLRVRHATDEQLDAFRLILKKGTPDHGAMRRRRRRLEPLPPKAPPKRTNFWPLS